MTTEQAFGNGKNEDKKDVYMREIFKYVLNE